MGSSLDVLGTQVVSKAGAAENGRGMPQGEEMNVRDKLLLLCSNAWSCDGENHSGH